MRKKLIIISLIILIFLVGCLSAPHATDYPNDTVTELENEQDYALYESDVWSETTNSVNESESYILDLGTRTQDGSMHIFIQSKAPDTTYKMNISDVELVEKDNEKRMLINASVEQTDDNIIGATVITEVHQHVEIKEYIQTDLDYVSVNIKDGWGETIKLEREACGCVLKEDPKPN